MVGQTVEIDVNLQGLAVGSDFIFNLNTRVLFDSSLFQAVPDPTNTSGLTAVVAPGSVFFNNVQGPLQIANFYANSSLTAGAANGIFAQSPNTNSGAIGLDGLYYSFELKAIAAGTGSILFDPTPGANEYAADDTGFNYAPLPNLGPLGFTINAVPQPSSIALLGIGFAGLGYWARRRRSATV
jgi:PEP-CTERM motif